MVIDQAWIVSTAQSGRGLEPGHLFSCWGSRAKVLGHHQCCVRLLVLELHSPLVKKQTTQCTHSYLPPRAQKHLTCSTTQHAHGSLAAITKCGMVALSCHQTTDLSTHFGGLVLCSSSKLCYVAIFLYAMLWQWLIISKGSSSRFALTNLLSDHPISGLDKANLDELPLRL